ncbi:response regulator, partial [Candidatus Aerophobetes bacterium]|nr:response regulator [Candidatus Aerophobetes bacterium]
MLEKEKILVVDDEVSISQACKKILTKEGFDVEIALDGVEAKKLIEKKEFGIVIVDLKLPGLSGDELLRWIREFDQDIVCIVITGYPSYDSAVASVKKGAYDYIPKPFTAGELRRVVRKAMDRRLLLKKMRQLQEEKEKNLQLLAQEKTKLKVVINSMTDAVLVVNNKGELVLYNLAAERILGIKKEELERPFKEVVKNQTIREMVETIMDGRGALALSREIKINGKSYLVNIAPVKEDEEMLGFVVSLRDITEIRRMSDIKSAFLTMVAHEVRSPLGIIEGYLDLILKGIVEDKKKT